ncbi:hypothetical protein LOTGIDRAFT_231532 [Lottia gigantea]|uniref:BAI1-associated protein 3 n=1 Tax=Lottia gigantea TaxID=225164 RepID=V4AJT1_LOTGI|nr:hypothetical protein LOTGIDRAFT_231532 [Lottia gigantea]ESO97337.1 hypothetical protein LOTGIDRAFT_231532 [Lottia gigantea]
MADSSSISLDDKSLSSRGGVFARVINRLSGRRKSLSSDVRRSFRRTRKAYSLDQGVLRANLELRASQERFLGIKRRLSRESSAPTFVQDRRQSDAYLNYYEHEEIYRGILRTLLHPLGAPDHHIGVRPGDLIDHIQEVFEVERDDHERFLRDEIRNKPRQLLLGVRVVEAKDLEIQRQQKDYKAYCLLQLTSALKKSNRSSSSLCRSARSSPKNSPKPSPKTSPKTSPKIPLGKLSPVRSSNASPWRDRDKVMKTQTVASSDQPLYWNEEFHIKISEMLTDELQVYIFTQETVSEKSEKTKKLKGLFKRNDTDKILDVNGGHVIIPIRDIPVQGIDDWFNFYPVSGDKSQQVGKCHLQLSLSHVQGSQYMSLFSAEDYHLVSSQLHRFCLQNVQSEGKREVSLPEKSRKILDIFGSANRISTLSQSIMDLTVLLELASGSDYESISDSVLHKALTNVQMTWMAKQVGDEAFAERMPLSDAEICVYRTATRNYIAAISERLDKLPCLFPPSTEHLAILKSKLGIVVDLLEMDLWDSTICPGEELTERLTRKLQDDIKEWLSINLSSVSEHEFIKDPVITECTTLTEVVNNLTSHCTQLGVITKFYNSFNIKYYRIVILITENLLVKELRHQMYEMDKYQNKYHYYPENITFSSRITLQLYFAVRKYYDVVKEYLKQRDLFRISFSHYQTWFENSLIFWLQTFKTECMARVEKALEIDKDVVLVTSLVKFSNSSVDTLSCFAKITEEWNQIDFQMPDLAMMAVTKITDMICEGAGMYADKIHRLLERNCYYDDQQEQFDVTDRLCITLNNIEHVRQYLHELPELLNWHSVAESLSLKHENPLIGKQSLKTLKRLISTTQCDISLKSKYLLREIGNKMKVNIEQSMKNLRKQPEKPSSIDETLFYLSTNLETLNTRLMTSIYPQMLEDLWNVVLMIFDHQLLVGHFKSLSAFFIDCGMSECTVKRGQYKQVMERLELNSMTSEDLMLSYFDNLAQSVQTPTDFLGSLAVKVAYEEETRNNVAIHIKVLRAAGLPGLDPTGFSDPYVTINIRPHILAGSQKTKRTPVIYKTLDPTFNTDFVFTSIPQYYLKKKGAVLLFSVYDFDQLTADDFAGEFAIHLDTLHKLTDNLTVDSLQAIILPLKRPKLEKHGPFQVLTERQPRDKVAKYFVSERLRVINNQRERTDKIKYSALCGFFHF